MTTQQTDLEKSEVKETSINIVDKIREKLGGKELSNELQKKIIEARTEYVETKDKVQDLYRYCVNTEGLSKEEGKTIVAVILDISIRTTELYVPEDMKDKKYVSNKIQESQKAKSLSHKEQGRDNATPGILNEDGKYGRADGTNTGQVLEDGAVVEQEQQEEKTPTESPEQTLKRLSKPFKQECDIVIAGRSFTVTVKVNVLERTVDLVYNELEISRALKGNRNK